MPFRRYIPLGILAVILMSVSVAAPSAATPLLGTGSITFSELPDTGPTAGAPVFDANGQLESAGSGHPTFDTAHPVGPQQTVSTVNPSTDLFKTDIFAKPPALSLTAAPASIGVNNVLDYGAMGLTAGYAGDPSPLFAVRMSSPVTDHRAAHFRQIVEASTNNGYGALNWTADLTLRNDSGSDMVAYVVSGLHLIFEIPHTAGGYAAASLYVTVNAGGIDYPIDPIVIAIDTKNLLPNVVVADQSPLLTFAGYDAPTDRDRYNVGGFSFTGPVSLQAGDDWTIHGAFTGVVDPGAAILVGGNSFLKATTSVPEPGGIWLMVSGLLGAGLVLRKRGHAGRRCRRGQSWNIFRWVFLQPA